MIYRLFNGGMTPVKYVTASMKEGLKDAKLSTHRHGYYFTSGRQRYFSNSKDPHDKTSYAAPENAY